MEYPLRRTGWGGCIVPAPVVPRNSPGGAPRASGMRGISINPRIKRDSGSGAAPLYALLSKAAPRRTRRGHLVLILHGYFATPASPQWRAADAPGRKWTSCDAGARRELASAQVCYHTDDWGSRSGDHVHVTGHSKRRASSGMCICDRGVRGQMKLSLGFIKSAAQPG